MESEMPSNYFILCPLLLLPSIFHSIKVFSNESVLRIREPKYWSFNFGISPSSEYSGPIPLGLTGLISLQPKGLSRVFSNTIVQKHNSLALNILYSPTLTSYMTTGKAIALIRWAFVGKVISLFFNMLSKFAIAFLPRSQCLLISCLQSPSAVILEPKKIKSVMVSIVSPYIRHEVMGLDVMCLHFLNVEF